jgi:DNA-binding NarL/FixJ family response regulator
MKLAHSILMLKRAPSRLDNALKSLADAGYAIVTTRTADETIEHAATKPFPLVLVETESLASVIGLLGVLRRADALSSIVVVTEKVDLNSVVHGIRLRIADIFSGADDDAAILGRVRSLLPAAPIVVTRLNKQIDQLSGEKQALEERLRALAGEFELWQKTVSGAITCATAHISGPGSTTAPSAVNQTEVLQFVLGTNPGAVAPATPAEHTLAEAASGGMRLKPLIDFIVKQAGGGTAGQLAVYHVFLKVPLNLLHAAKIPSLQLVDETSEIHSPHLVRIILAAVRETLGVEYVPVPAMAVAV